MYSCKGDLTVIFTWSLQWGILVKRCKLSKAAVCAYKNTYSLQKACVCWQWHANNGVYKCNPSLYCKLRGHDELKFITLNSKVIKCLPATVTLHPNFWPCKDELSIWNRDLKKKSLYTCAHWHTQSLQASKYSLTNSLHGVACVLHWSAERKQFFYYASRVPKVPSSYFRRHACTHACTHARTHACTHVHTHTHTLTKCCCFTNALPSTYILASACKQWITIITIQDCITSVGLWYNWFGTFF